MDEIRERLDAIENRLDATLNIRVFVDKSFPNARMPHKAYTTDSGFDLFNGENDVIIEPASAQVINTGIKLDLPEGIEVQVRPRSGLASKRLITVLNTPGTVDSGYRGYVKVILFNNSKERTRITAGMKIAQMVFGRVLRIELSALDSEEYLSPTPRSAHGFGSTGVE